MMVINRFRVPETEQATFRDDLERARETLAEQRRYVSGRIGRNLRPVQPGTALNRTTARSLG